MVTSSNFDCTEEYGTSFFLLQSQFGKETHGEETFASAINKEKVALKDLSSQYDKMQAALIDLEQATDKTMEQENRMENQLEAFGSMLNEFEDNQTELLTLIQTA